MTDDRNVAADDHDHEPVDRRAHGRLLAGVTRLNKTQFIKKPTRNEPALRHTEFDTVKSDDRSGGGGGGDDSAPASVRRAARAAIVSVPDLVRRLNADSGKHASIGRTLRNVQNSHKRLDRPLERPVTERIARTVGYERAKKKLNRWNALVTRHRATDHMAFPLPELDDRNALQIVDGRRGADAAADAARPKFGHFKIQSELELALQAFDPPPPAVEVYTQAATGAAAAAAELQQLSRAEMLARSKELRLLRMRESQRSAKNRLHRKIKSKKFHQIQKKERLKDQLKDFETLQQTDPEAAMRKLQQLEKQRVEERALLRHKNTGTWAKNLQVRAKYDKDVRKELSEQLAISRELTAKRDDPDDDDDDGEEEDEQAAAVQAAPVRSEDVFNPWLKRNAVATAAAEQAAAAADAVGGYRKYWNERNANETAVRQYRQEPAAQAAAAARSASSKTSKTTTTVTGGWLIEDAPVAASGKALRRDAADQLDDLFDGAEDALRANVSAKLQSFLQRTGDAGADANGRSRQAKRARKTDASDLSFKSTAKRPQIDEQLEHGSDAEGDDDDADTDADASAAKRAVEELRQMANQKTAAPAIVAPGADINPDTFMRVVPKHLQTALPEMDGEHDDDDSDGGGGGGDDVKRLTIAEAFEDDDIVANFAQEHDDERTKNEPADIDLTLPGWGSWGGNGIDPQRRRHRTKQLVLKFPKPEQRKAENRGNVIIVDNDNRRLRDHQVAQLPFPFTSVADYEASIRAPLGRDFVPAVAHQLLTKPAVQTQLGAIIAPMHEDMLMRRPLAARTKTAKRIAALALAKAEQN